MTGDKLIALHTASQPESPKVCFKPSLKVCVDHSWLKTPQNDSGLRSGEKVSNETPLLNHLHLNQLQYRTALNPGLNDLKELSSPFFKKNFIKTGESPLLCQERLLG